MSRFKGMVWLGSFLALGLAAGCGLVLPLTVFPNQLVDSAGAPIYLEDLEAIVQDPDMSDNEMTQALESLGIEDHDLIDAIIDDGLGG